MTLDMQNVGMYKHANTLAHTHIHTYTTGIGNGMDVRRLTSNEQEQIIFHIFLHNLISNIFQLYLISW